jgi:hypothetical protein
MKTVRLKSHKNISLYLKRIEYKEKFDSFEKVFS